MSRSCAKPICSDPAVSWFDLSRVTQQVTRSSFPTDLGIALCASHAERFSVPEGWTLTTIDAEEQPEIEQPEVHAEVLAPADLLSPEVDAEADADAAAATGTNDTSTDDVVERHRSHDRDNPWFVGAPAADEAHADTTPSDDWSLANPTEGSLLHRAFHGPTASDEGEQATEGNAGALAAPVDELSPRRRARSSSDDAEEEAVGGYREFELPFPPHSPRNQRVAVS